MTKCVSPTISLFLLVGMFLFFQTTPSMAAAPQSCKKLGVNFAVPGPVTNAQYNRAVFYNMGYTLEIATVPGQEWSMSNSFNYALDHGIIPIVRICYGTSCAFANPATYTDFLNRLADLVGGRDFYALAGPNEPLAETWLPGLEAVNYPYDDGEIDLVAQKNAAYMRSVADGILKPNVKLLSPAFNTTEPDFEKFVARLRVHAGPFHRMEGIAGNLYNVNGARISFWLSRMRTAGFTTEPLFLTEIGMFEENGVTRAQAITKLAQELELLRADSQVKAYLLFNSFGTNTTPGFAYNVFTDSEFNQLIPSICRLGLSADFNHDSVVNGLDASILFSNWNTTSAVTDLDASGKTNSFDYALFKVQWGVQY